MIAPKRKNTDFKSTPKGRQFSTQISLEGIAELRFEGQAIGSLILKPDKGSGGYQLVVGFATEGFHSYQSAETTDDLLTKLEQGLKQIPHNESLTVHLSKYASDKARKKQPNTNFGAVKSKLNRLETLSKEQRIRELENSGQRQHIEIAAYSTITLSRAYDADTDGIEKLLKVIEKASKAFKTRDEHNQSMALLLQEAYFEGFYDWLNFFSRMGLEVKPLNAQQLWQKASLPFNREQTPPLPQLLVADETGVTEQINSHCHPGDILTRYGMPEASPDHVKIGNQYVGAVTMQDKLDGFDSSEGQLRYLFNVIKQPSVRDVDVVVQFTPTDNKLIKGSLQLRNRQANTQVGRADDQMATDVSAMITADETVQAQQALITGNKPIKVGLVVLVRRKTLRRLATACKQVESQFTGNSWMERECHLAPQTWLQTLAVSGQQLLKYSIYDQRQTFFSHEATGLLSLVKPRRYDSDGIELITEEGSVPIYLDFLRPHKQLGRRSLLVLGTTRSGKSLAIAEILLLALKLGLLVTIVDYPKPNGESTFSSFTQLSGGAYVDITKERLNILELPDLREFSEEEQQERLDTFAAAILPLLTQLVIGSDTLEQLPASSSVIKSVLKLALNEFLQDASILARTQEAHREGQGSKAWLRMPTLFDFLHLLESVFFQESLPSTSIDAVNHCIFQINSLVRSPGLGKSISQPSTVQADAQLVVFAMTNITDPDEEALVAMLANLVALRRALAAPASIFFIDEAAILLKNDQFSMMVGRICANGSKAGISVIVAAQDPDTIAGSKAGSQILQNLNTRLIGRIQSTAIASFERDLEIPRAVITPNAGEGFFPNPQGMYSNWLVNEGDSFTRCRFYPSPILLALTANNTDEQEGRDVVMRQYPDRPLEGLAAFAKLLARSIQSGESLSATIERWLTSAT